MSGTTDSTMPSLQLTWRQQVLRWLLITGFWLLIALASLLETSWFFPNGATVFWRAVAWLWLPWIVLTPVMLWLTGRFTIERNTWRRNIWVHLGAAVVILGGLGVLSYFVFVRPYSREEGTNSWPEAQRPGQAPGPRGMGAGGGGAPRGGDRFYNGPFEPGSRDAGGVTNPSFGPGGGRYGGGNDWPRDWPEGGPGRWGGGGPGYHPPFGGMGQPPYNAPFRWGPPTAQIMLAGATLQLPTFLAVLGMAHALLFYQRSRERERRGAELESRLTQARLQALRMQLNPHFLFNTLNSISSLVYDQPKAADEMIESLSVLLRQTLGSSDRQEVTLEEELEVLDQYLFIEQTRFGGRLKIERHIEPETLRVRTPILILQPLVENAFKHGVEAQLAPGVVSISAKRIGDKLHLEVADNGKGVAAGATAPLKEGVGLSNTRARLRELYGEDGKLSYGARPEGGFWVAAQMPWRPLAADGKTKEEKKS